MSKDDRFGILMCLFFVLIFTFVGIFMIFSYRNRILKCTEVTEGVVVKIVRNGGNNGGKYPIVECVIQGQKVKMRSSHSKSFTSLKQGDAVTVHYNPKNGDMWIEGYDNHWTSYLMGVAFIAFGVFWGSIPFLVARNPKSSNA